MPAPRCVSVLRLWPQGFVLGSGEVRRLPALLQQARARRADGVLAYLTHQGSRTVTLGQRVRAGQVIGTVGHWPGNPGRSHTHEGVSSLHGEADAKKIIRAISVAPKVPAV